MTRYNPTHAPSRSMGHNPLIFSAFQAAPGHRQHTTPLSPHFGTPLAFLRRSGRFVFLFKAPQGKEQSRVTLRNDNQPYERGFDTGKERRDATGDVFIAQVSAETMFIEMIQGTPALILTR